MPPELFFEMTKLWAAKVWYGADHTELLCSEKLGELLMEEKIFYENKEDGFYISQKTLDYLSELFGDTYFQTILFWIDEQKNFQEPIISELSTENIKYRLDYDTEKDLPILIGKSKKCNVVEKIELDKIDTINKLKNFSMNYDTAGSFGEIFREKIDLIADRIQLNFEANKYLIPKKIYTGTGYVIDTETDSYIDAFNRINFYIENNEEKLKIFFENTCRDICFRSFKESVVIDFYFDNGFDSLRFKNFSVIKDIPCDLNLLGTLLTVDEVYLCPPNKNLKLAKDFNGRDEFYEYCKKNLFGKKTKPKKMFGDLIL